ncbi:MAG: calcium-binding protein [Phormidesmis sp. CAN_BIN36]|nr:calcium-binding protein [Phormidesmis sp. CAN_BIN36]
MTGTTRRVSYGLDQSPVFSPLPLESYALSPDGRYVAYVATIFFDELKQASAVQEGYKSVLLRDTVAGTTTLISVPLGVAPVTTLPPGKFSLPLGSSPQRDSGGLLSVSASGRYVVFSSDSPVLVAGDTNSSTDLFVRDTVTNTTTRISVDSNENQALYSYSGVIDSRQLSITPDGRYIAFGSTAFNLVPNDIYATSDIFVRDTVAGTTEVISTDSSGNLPKVTGYSYGESLNPQITLDGRYVVFGSYAPNLVPNDTNQSFDIFVKDRQTSKTTRVSTDSAGNQGTIGKSSYDPYSSPSISAHGRYVAFESDFTNSVPGDTNEVADVFVKDVLTGSITRVSVGINGQQSNGKSYGVVSSPSISADGRFVAFASDASNLVPNDLLGAPDVFVYDRQTSSTNRVSVTSEGFDAVDGLLGTRSYLPTISADGRFVAFVSNAANLANDGFKTNTNNIFLHDTRPGNPSPGSPASGKSGDGLSGMPNGNPLVGGTTNDVLIAKKGAQTLTGGLGKDRFVFTQLDRHSDRITDFVPKQDKIVLTQLLDRVTKRNYKGNAIADKIVSFTTRGSNVQINIDRNGLRSGGLQALVLVEDLSIADIKPRSNFVF